jgi:CheY-like chemotaxis protein
VFERRPLDLLSLLKEEVKLLQRTLPENIEIQFEHGVGNYIVRADVTRIQQTIMNLAFNARDAMPEGGRLQFKLSHLPLDNAEQAPLPMMQPGSWVHLSVKDSGTGIASAVLDHIFEPFVTTKEPGKGTGLGLSQVHGIVAQHAGYITVQSEPGVGTTFDVYLPAMMVEADIVLPEPPETAVPGQGERLLVVEDEPDLRNALVESLTLLQYDVIEAANGAEALALLEQGTAVDLIICDVIMPQMGGLPFMQALQRLNAPPPVIFVTGHPLDIEPDNLREMGVRNVLSKPVQPAQLSQAIAAALRG